MARIAIADIHGCTQTFKALLHQTIGVSKSDELYLLGDFINKGPDSKGTLDYVLQLIEEGYHVRCVRGNHDQMLLDAQLADVSAGWKEVQRKNTLDSFHIDRPQQVPEKYLDFIRSMPYFIELDHFFLVHAGFFTGIGDPFLDKVAMMNIKKFTYLKEEFNGKKIIHGHLPQMLPELEKRIQSPEQVIKIDGGCVYYKNQEYGNLIALDIDSLEVLVQRNCDFPYEVAVRGN